MPRELIELRTSLLARHDREAAALRERYDAAGTVVVNLISGPGSGKTALLVELLSYLRAGSHRVAALVGDCATDNDARRLAASGVPVRQIVTEGLCHLEAHHIGDHLGDWDLAEIEVLFIENVGNLVCPSDFDLGEHVRIVLLSVTEGEDKPLKYPQIFHSADLAVITKLDLAGPCGFEAALALAAIERVHPGMPVMQTSARSRLGVETLADALLHARNTRVSPGAH